jgi:DNA repair protein RecO (recombination protein O)
MSTLTGVGTVSGKRRLIAASIPCLFSEAMVAPGMRPSQAGLAIILRTRPFRESDKIVTFLTRDFGKLTGIAKGAKNSRRRFANCLDPMTRVRVYFRARPAASLVFMESCDLLRPPGAFSEPSRFAYGSYLVELTDQLTGEGHAVPELYHLLEAALSELETGQATGAFLRAFELQLLQLAGYEPHFESCVTCRRSLAGCLEVFLDPSTGGLTCEGCGAREPGRVGFRGETVTMLESLKRADLASARSTRLTTLLAAEANQLLGRLLVLHLPRPLKSIGLIASLTRQRTAAANDPSLPLEFRDGDDQPR